MALSLKGFFGWLFLLLLLATVNSIDEGECDGMCAKKTEDLDASLQDFVHIKDPSHWSLSLHPSENSKVEVAPKKPLRVYTSPELDFVVKKPSGNFEKRICKNWLKIGNCNLTAIYNKDNLKMLTFVADGRGIASVPFDAKEVPIDVKFHVDESGNASIDKYSVTELCNAWKNSNGKIDFQLGWPSDDDRCDVKLLFDGGHYQIAASTTTTTSAPPTTTPTVHIDHTSGTSSSGNSFSGQTSPSQEFDVTSDGTEASKSGRHRGDIYDIIFFIFFGCVVIALLVTLALTYRCYRKMRRFEQKYRPMQSRTVDPVTLGVEKTREEGKTPFVRKRQSGIGKENKRESIYATVGAKPSATKQPPVEDKRQPINASADVKPSAKKQPPGDEKRPYEVNGYVVLGDMNPSTNETEK